MEIDSNAGHVKVFETCCKMNIDLWWTITLDVARTAISFPYPFAVHLILLSHLDLNQITTSFFRV
jgi:hypothetical protein